MVHLNNGDKIIAKFKEKHSRFITFFDYEDILISEIRTISIHKGKT